MILTNKLAFSTLNPLLWENIIPSSHARYMMRWHQPFGVGDPLRVQCKVQAGDTDTYTLHIRKAGIGHFEHTLDGATVVTVPFTRNVLSVGNEFIDAYYEINLDYGCYYAEVRDSQDRPMAYSHFFQVVEDLTNTFEWRIRQDRNLNLFSFKTIYSETGEDLNLNDDLEADTNWDLGFKYIGTSEESKISYVGIFAYGEPRDNIEIHLISDTGLNIANVQILDIDGNVLATLRHENFYNTYTIYTSYIDEQTNILNFDSQFVKFKIERNEEFPDGFDTWESEIVWFDTSIDRDFTLEGVFMGAKEVTDFFMRLHGGFREDEMDINIKGGIFEQQDLIPYEMHAKAYEKLNLTIDAIPNWMATKVALWTTIREKTIDDSEMAWNGDDIEVVDRDKLDRGFQILKISFSDKFGIDEQKSSCGAYICDETYTPIETTQGTLIL